MVLRQSPSDETIHTIAYKVAEGVGGMGWEAESGKDSIHWVCDVSECVEQCAVKVEYDCLKLYFVTSEELNFNKRADYNKS